MVEEILLAQSHDRSEQYTTNLLFEIPKVPGRLRDAEWKNENAFYSAHIVGSQHRMAVFRFICPFEIRPCSGI